MVNNSAVHLDRVFGAFADSTRRSIVERLSLGALTVTEIAAPFASSLPAVSKHLSVLERAGLIVRRTSGRNRICELTPAALDAPSRWMEERRQVWNERLDALEAFLASDQEKKE